MFWGKQERRNIFETWRQFLKKKLEITIRDYATSDYSVYFDQVPKKPVHENHPTNGGELCGVWGIGRVGT